MLKSLGIGAKDLPLPPLPPTVIQESAMASDDDGVGDNAASTSPGATGNCTTVVYAFPEEDRLVVGYLNEWINAYSFITSEYIGPISCYFQPVNPRTVQNPLAIFNPLYMDQPCQGWIRQVVSSPTSEIAEQYLSARLCLITLRYIYICICT